MPLAVAQTVVLLAASYLAAGLLFAFLFAFRWSGRLDPVAGAGSPGFRLLILPGAMLLWPLLAWRLRPTASR